MGYSRIQFHTAVLSVYCNACYVHFILIRDEWKAKTLSDTTSNMWMGKTIKFPEFWYQINTWPIVLVLSAKPGIEYILVLKDIHKLTWSGPNLKLIKHPWPFQIYFCSEAIQKFWKVAAYRINRALEINEIYNVKERILIFFFSILFSYQASHFICMYG